MRIEQVYPGGSPEFAPTGGKQQQQPQGRNFAYTPSPFPHRLANHDPQTTATSAADSGSWGPSTGERDHL